MRAKTKGTFYDKTILKTLDKNPNNIIIWSRRSTILPQFLDKTVLIYNGKLFVKQKITIEMIGHKFGEFSFTRKIYQYKKKKKK